MLKVKIGDLASRLFMLAVLSACLFTFSSAKADGCSSGYNQRIATCNDYYFSGQCAEVNCHDYVPYQQCVDGNCGAIARSQCYSFCTSCECDGNQWACGSPM